MSASQAIPAVTSALASRIETAIRSVPAAQVSTQRPDQPDPEQRPRVNLFLFHAVPNPYLRNNDLPTRLANGQLVEYPTVPLDLHYLISFFGSEQRARLEPQVLLGLTVNALHANPIIPVDEVAAHARAERLSGESEDPPLMVEPVNLAPRPVEIEELSRLWSMAFQSPYALSVAYRASVALLVDDSAQPETPKLVLHRQFDYTVMEDK